MAASCEQCTQGYVLAGEPEGSLVDGAYLHPVPEGGAHPTSAVVILTDIFGLPLKNCKIVADELSKRIGCDAWVPDLFAGASTVNNMDARTESLFVVTIGRPVFAPEELEPLMPKRPTDKLTIWTQLWVALKALSRLPRVYNARPSAVDARIVSVRVIRPMLYARYEADVQNLYICSS